MPVWTVALAFIVTLFAAPPAQPGTCPLAPAPRLRPGMEAVVAPGQWGLNLSALPAVSTGVRAQIGAGQRMTVLDGPSCNGHYRWFRVELPNGVSGWLAEGSWAEYYILPASDADPSAPGPTVEPADWSCRERFDPRDCPVMD